MTERQSSDAASRTEVETGLHAERWSTPALTQRLRKRQRAERIFKGCGAAAIAFALGSLALLLVSTFATGKDAFIATELQLDVDLSAYSLPPQSERSAADTAERLDRIDYRGEVKKALRAAFPDVTGRKEKRELGSLLSRGAARVLEDAVFENPTLAGTQFPIWLPADDEVDLFRKAGQDGVERFGERKAAWFQTFDEQGRLRSTLNRAFLTSGDSREPELAGVWGALVGSFWTLMVTLIIVLPLGLAASVYLEEFAVKNRWTEIIEVNINNLAAVPSIVFGILGLAFFLGTLDLPRSAPLVGGLTLSLMTLPTIIITARVSIQAVAPSIREAALGIGASPLQVVAHHVLPVAMPGILTGTIIGMARALGETAPLLMIGMVAFVVDVPTGPTDAATALPVQIFLWSDSPERAFAEKTTGAILVLLAFLIVMNGSAVALRRRFERRGS
ncbi:MAG: phosphate ABC transporter permease PstA [Myxococcota bacterium]